MDDICRQLDEMMQEAKRVHQQGIVHEARVKLAKVLFKSFEADAAVIAAATAIEPAPAAVPLQSAPAPPNSQRQPLPHEQWPQPPWANSPGAQQFYHDHSTQE